MFCCVSYYNLVNTQKSTSILTLYQGSVNDTALLCIIYSAMIQHLKLKWMSTVVYIQ